MTDYKLVFKPNFCIDHTIRKPADLPPFLDDYLAVPLSYIHKCEKKIIE